MANRNKRRINSPINVRGINAWINNVNTSMERLYNDTYLSDRTNMSDLENITDDIEDNINAIIRRNNEFDSSNITKLYSRLMLKNSVNKDNELAGQIENMFNDTDFNNILTNYMSNKWIKDLDNEIDTVLKYCTKMGEALDLMRDAVIASDSTTKDTVIVKAPITDKAELSTFYDRTAKISTKYDMDKKRLEWYMNASKYGEQYVYCVPYNKALTKLLQQKSKSMSSIPVMESGNISILEDMNLLDDSIKKELQVSAKKCNGNFTIEIDKGRKLQSALEDVKLINESIEAVSESSMHEQFVALREETSEKKKKVFDKTIDASELELPPNFDSASDGLITPSSRSIRKKVDVKGAVLKDLKRENLIPIYVDDTCLGYYYFEFNNNQGFNFYNNVIDTYGKGYQTQDSKSLTETIANGMNNNGVDLMLRKIAGKLSSELDEDFINANQDLTKEIYSILKHNNAFNSLNGDTDSPSAVRVSFLPVDDVHRLYFNEDEETHRGISDCTKGLIPAKLFSCLYITNATGILTRGQDKRVYYVKQTVETNIAQTMLNVINQIKKSNFGLRQIENMNNILNITGRFNDYIIPVGPSGDSPVQFEVMPGQQFEINSELYNMLEEMAVNSTGVPIELVQSRMSPDFATQFTSSSIKVLRSVYSRQNTYEKFESGIWTKLYNYEYPDENITVESELPPPIFLSMTNTTQLIQNTKEYVMQIAEYEFDGEQGDTVEEEKAVFIKKMMRSILSSYVRTRDIMKFKDAAKMEVQSKKSANTSEE